MAAHKWGKKRICISCGARFYDLLRRPIICPKCGTEFVPVVSGRGSRAKAAAPKLAKPEVEETKKSDLLVAEENIPDDPGMGILDGDEDDLIEDTSDLGADDEVFDGIGSNSEKPDDLTG